ncbi:hypothetical protein GX48_01033 [Paracoccidioides brasiliensis]|nr:hypothetical protein GX48_01033 [Paracoccidioides brasiliensis]
MVLYFKDDDYYVRHQRLLPTAEDPRFGLLHPGRSVLQGTLLVTTGDTRFEDNIDRGNGFGGQVLFSGGSILKPLGMSGISGGSQMVIPPFDVAVIKCGWREITP